MSLHLFNTMTRRKEAFAPADGRTVKLYCCGPTVYNYAHIGNLRTYLFEDLMRRVLEWQGWEVEHVMNITDVGHMTSDADAGEDKMMKAAQREQKSPWEIARFYEDAFLHDLERLHIRPPKVLCRATDHIAQMIAMIQTLETRGFTYRTSEGIYFDTARDDDYGALAGLNLAAQREGARDEVNTDPEKKHPADFVLWFTNKPSHVMQWESPWGTGYPGWHIECSAMSTTYLGDTLDIHAGGIDHIPVHNTNEIAQSECATGHLFARFWLHGAFLNVKTSSAGATKMAKSGDNFLTVERLIDRAYDPIVYRYLTFSAHYRSELAFSWDALEGARRALARVYALRAKSGEEDDLSTPRLQEASAEVEAALLDDLNAPRALAALHEAQSYALWKKYDAVFALDIEKRSPAVMGSKLPEPIALLASKREAARDARDWALADILRKELEDSGYVVGDTPAGMTVRPRLV